MMRPSPIPGMDASEYAMRWLLARGYSQAAAAGIVGNLMHESRMDTSILGDNRTSLGLAQWRGVRQTALRQFAARNGVSPYDMDLQLSFLHRELTQDPTYRKALRGLMVARDPSEAAGYFAEHFERPRGSGRGNFAAIHGWGNRARYATQMFRGGFDQPYQAPDPLNIAQGTRQLRGASDADVLADPARPSGPISPDITVAPSRTAGPGVTPTPPARPAGLSYDPLQGPPIPNGYNPPNPVPGAEPGTGGLLPRDWEQTTPAADRQRYFEQIGRNAVAGVLPGTPIGSGDGTAGAVAAGAGSPVTPPPPRPDFVPTQPAGETFTLTEPQAQQTFRPRPMPVAAVPESGWLRPEQLGQPPDWARLFNFGGLFS